MLVIGRSRFARDRLTSVCRFHMTVAYHSCLDGPSAESVVMQRVVGVWEGRLKLDRALLPPFPLLGCTNTKSMYPPISPSALHCSKHEDGEHARLLHCSKSPSLHSPEIGRYGC